MSNEVLKLGGDMFMRGKLLVFACHIMLCDG